MLAVGMTLIFSLRINSCIASTRSLARILIWAPSLSKNRKVFIVSSTLAAALAAVSLPLPLPHPSQPSLPQGQVLLDLTNATVLLPGASISSASCCNGQSFLSVWSRALLFNLLERIFLPLTLWNQEAQQVAEVHFLARLSSLERCVNPSTHTKRQRR